jgi:hypothetical protein
VTAPQPERFVPEQPVIELLQFDGTQESAEAVDVWLERIDSVAYVAPSEGADLTVVTGDPANSFAVPATHWIRAVILSAGVTYTVHDRRPTLFGYVSTPIPACEPEAEPS